MGNKYYEDTFTKDRYEQLKKNSIGQKKIKIFGTTYRIVDPLRFKRAMYVAGTLLITVSLLGAYNAKPYIQQATNAIQENKESYMYAYSEALRELKESGFNMNSDNMEYEYFKIGHMSPLEVSLALPPEYTSEFLRYNGYESMDEYAKAQGFKDEFEYRKAMKQEYIQKMKSQEEIDKDMGGK